MERELLLFLVISENTVTGVCRISVGGQRGTLLLGGLRRGRGKEEGGEGEGRGGRERKRKRKGEEERGKRKGGRAGLLESRGRREGKREGEGGREKEGRSEEGRSEEEGGRKHTDRDLSIAGGIVEDLEEVAVVVTKERSNDGVLETCSDGQVHSLPWSWGG
jgi:hypothetical protein